MRRQREATSQRSRAGFTLIELLIVVVILGFLAAIALPMVNNASEQTRRNAFAQDVKIFARAAQRYSFEHGEFLEDSATGVCPAGLEEYIEVRKWTQETPIGGSWDAEFDSFGITSGFGVDFANGPGADRDDAYMAEVDALLDDGDVNTGTFRKIADGRYYYVIAQ
jgi:prepilin-type N-terminal cleavage/methylation domain-containing protein